MNIAEKLTRIAENEQKVFDAGRTDYWNEFWNGALSPSMYQYRFAGRCWNDKTFYPNKDIKLGDYSNHAFYGCYITDLAGRLRECGVTLDTSRVKVRCDALFINCSLLTTVPYLDLRNCTYSAGILTSMFNGCSALHTIEGIHLAEDGSQVFGTSIFTSCAKLENVTFYGTIGDNISFSPCVKLSKASIQNIVEHLSDTASGKKLTVPQVAVDSVFTTEEWDALVATKPNWTIALST